MNGFEPCSERIYALVLLTRSIICNSYPEVSRSGCSVTSDDRPLRRRPPESAIAEGEADPIGSHHALRDVDTEQYQRRQA
jgi:hypothetical protein